MQNEYKINIHAHTIFLDGRNTPVVMALEAKKLGFISLVLTDHFYGNGSSYSMNENLLPMESKAIAEAMAVLPVILGLEVPCCDQEVLIFGGSARKAILKNGKPKTIDELRNIKKNHYCAIILCHPSPGFEVLEKDIDGYEMYNSGQACFFSDHSPGKLIHKPAWSNSDAHNAQSLKYGWNVVDTKIKDEGGLVKYIKSGKRPELFYC